MKLNVGCGLRPLEGYTNLDIQALEGVDIVADAKDIPLEDETCSEVNSYGFIEHIEPEDTAQVMSEMYRVLKPGYACRIGTEDFGHQVKVYLEDGLNGWTHSAVYGPHYSHRRLFDEAELKKEMEKAGFVEIRNIGTYIGILELKGLKQQ